jgi:hypothetical protein
LKKSEKYSECTSEHVCSHTKNCVKMTLSVGCVKKDKINLVRSYFGAQKLSFLAQVTKNVIFSDTLCVDIYRLSECTSRFFFSYYILRYVFRAMG